MIAIRMDCPCCDEEIYGDGEDGCGYLEDKSYQCTICSRWFKFLVLDKYYISNVDCVQGDWIARMEEIN